MTTECMQTIIVKMVCSLALLVLFLQTTSMEALSSCESEEECADVVEKSPALLQTQKGSRGAIVQKDLVEENTTRKSGFSCGGSTYIHWNGGGRIDSKVEKISGDWWQGCWDCLNYIKRQGYQCSHNTNCHNGIWGVWLTSDNCWKTPTPTAAPTPAPTPAPPPLCCALKLNNPKPSPLIQPNANKFVSKTFFSEQVEFSNVCSAGGTSWDLLLSFQEFTGKYNQNKVVGDMFQLNMKQGTTLDLTFTLKKQGETWETSGTPLTEIIVSVLDLDQQPGAKQTVVAGNFSDVKFGSKVTKKKNHQVPTYYDFISERDGTLADNPVDPMHLSEVAKSSTVSFKYKNTNVWFWRLAVSGSAKSGRNFFLGGATELMSPTC